MKTIVNIIEFDFIGVRSYNLIFRTDLIKQSSLNIKQLVRENKILDNSSLTSSTPETLNAKANIIGLVAKMNSMISNSMNNMFPNPSLTPTERLILYSEASVISYRVSLK